MANFCNQVDWQPETLTFAIDGKTVRVVNKNDTAAADGANGYKYPSTPARIQLSIWPGGANTSAPGTIKWAGGPINFNDPDYVAAGGHFYASVAEVDVTCNDPVAAPQGATGYVYGTNASTTDVSSILISSCCLIVSCSNSRRSRSPTCRPC
jgi:beta-glucanase (GH16 family)